MAEVAKGVMDFQVEASCLPRGLRLTGQCDRGRKASPGTHCIRSQIRRRSEACGGLQGWLRRGGTHMQWSLEVFYFRGKQVLERLGEEINHGSLRAWVGFLQHLHELKEGQGVEMWRNPGSGGHGKSWGENDTVCRVNMTTCLPNKFSKKHSQHSNIVSEDSTSLLGNAAWPSACYYPRLHLRVTLRATQSV